MAYRRRVWFVKFGLYADVAPILLNVSNVSGYTNENLGFPVREGRLRVAMLANTG